jgi:hypothetical protein
MCARLLVLRATAATLAAAVLLIALPAAAAADPQCLPLFELDAEPGQENRIDLMSVCPDPDSDPLTAEVETQPAHGTAAFASQPFPAIVYVPEAGYQGADEFTFRALDDEGPSDPVTVMVTVLPPNLAPTCTTPLTLRIAPGERLPLDHRLACSDPEGAPVFPMLVSGPSHGTIDVTEWAGPFYVPNPGFTGVDRIQFTVTDPRGARSNVATLEIRVESQSPGTPPPGTPPPGTPPPVAPDLTGPALELQRAGSAKLRRLRTRGLRLRLASSEGATIAVELSIARKAARRLGVDRRATGRAVVGRLTRSVKAGETAFTVELRARVRKRLKGARRVLLRVAVTATDAAGNRTREVLRVKIRD